MKKFLSTLKDNRMSMLSFMLVALACLFGADVSMAMPDGTGAIADNKGLDTQLPGTAASATQLRDGDLVDPEIDTMIAKFRPYMWPLLSDIRLEAIQAPVKGYEVEHYATGAEILDYKTNSQITNNTAKETTVKLPCSKEAMKTIAKDSLIYFPTIAGYNGAEEDALGLVCQVVEKTSTEIKIEALNGPIDSDGDHQMYVPDIANETSFSIMDNALSESQMDCAPENFQPRPQTLYLQKSAVNIVMTDHWKEIVKKLPFIEQDVKDDALAKYNRKRARNLWVGVMTKRKVYQGDKMGDEYVYTSKGVLRQILNMYGLGETMEYADLIRICKLQFTENAVNKKARVYCGKGFIEKLLNIDYTKHKDIEFVSRQVIGIDIRAFKCTFGELEFVHDPTLDDIGFEDYACVIDIKNAKRYVKETGKDYKIDMKEGGSGENREATKDIHIEADCVGLRGYNSILVGPSGSILGRAAKNATIKFTSQATVPTESLSDGMIVHLTADAGAWKKDQLITYDAATKTWSEYHGVIEEDYKA